MNNIYKVIWSKAKNCYVVASEIARSHTKSASGSEKIGGGTRRKLLASLMALSLLCGGLGVAEASVHVNEVPDGTKEVYTIGETYSREVADAKLDLKADKTDVVTNTANIATNADKITKLENDKLDKALASEMYATNDTLNALKDTVNGKADAATVTTALGDKANTDLSNLTADGVTKIKNTMSADMDLKANKADVYSKTDADDTFATKTELKAKADATELAGKANKTDLENATNRITMNEGNISDLQKKTVNLSDDGKELTGMTTVEAGALKVTGGISDGAGVNTTLADINDSMTQTATNKEAIANLQTITNNQQTAIDDLKKKTTMIDYDTATDTTIVNGMKVGQQVDMGGKNLTHVGTINGIDLGTKEGGNYISQDGSIWGNMKTVDTQVKTNAVNIETNKNAITALDTKVGTVGTGTYLDPNKPIGENLGRLNAGLEKEVGDRTAEDTNLSNRIGTVTENGNYIKKSDTNNVSENLIVLDTQAKTNADAIAKETADRKAAIGELAVNGNYIEKDKNVSDNLVELDKQAKANADAITETNQRTAGINRDDTKKETSIEGKVTVDTNGNIKAEGTITSNGLDARAGEIKTTGKVSAGDVSTGTLETTGNAKIGGDLTVNGKLNVGEIYMEHKKQESTGEEYDSATSITADGISNNAKVTDRNGVKTESKFTHDKEGSTTYAYQGDAANWKKSTSNVTADGVENVAEDSKDNNNTFTQTSTDTKNTLTDKEGNTSSTRQDSKGIYGYAKDKDGNKSYTKQEGNRIAESVIGQDGKQTKSEMTSTDITNTAKDGTIKNDAKDIVNNASGNISNKSQTMDTTVTGKATESYGELETTVNGKETHNVTGTKTENVTGKVTENYNGGQETNVTGNQDIHVTKNQTNKIDGDQVNIIGGSQTTTATDINRNASSSMVDKVDNAYGTNTETKEAGKTTTDVSIKGTGEKGQYIRGANESRDYLIKGSLKNSETKTAEATSSEITDGTNTASTRQDAKNLAGFVTNGTETGISGIHANDDGSVSIDSAVAGGGMSSVINQKKDSITSAVGDGTNSTVILQDKDNVTIASSNGTVGIVGKDIVNNATGNMTNTVGGNQTNTIGGNQTTTVTGDILNKAENITNEANTKLTDKVGDHTRVLDHDGITDTVGGSTFKQRIDKIMMESKDVSIKAEETLTNEAKVITNKASEVINNEAVNINNTATGIITSKASEIKNQADKLISNKVGENTWENMENGKITTSIKDGAKQNLTQSDAAGTTQSTVDGGKSTVTIQNADGLTGAVTDGRNTSVQNQTASAIATDVKDGAGNENASVANATTSANTITNGTKTNTVISTVDGTSFINSEANTAFEGGTYTDTTIKGNTITTGKVTMDYADVMKDLGVKGTTTTKTLKVTENATVGGTLDVTQRATFHDAVDIAKDLSVGGNATIAGDVTANSYKVGDKTYISAAGINANDQKITNVADGSISEGSKDAVNGGQLYGVKRDLEHQVDKVGANAAAMANLRPMEFDPSSKWNIAAAIGNYGSETAAALGAFYRPNDNVMVNLSTAFGTGENMVGGGVSVRLGKGGNKLSRQESNALKAQVNDLTARMDALLSVLNPNMSKDFPDVPENHWAYEAVSRLAGNDIVQGYPDGEFHGERTMTRYEMAEIIYNALSRGAEAERELVEEFKPELQAMAASEKATAERAEG